MSGTITNTSGDVIGVPTNIARTTYVATQILVSSAMENMTEGSNTTAGMTTTTASAGCLDNNLDCAFNKLSAKKVLAIALSVTIGTLAIAIGVIALLVARKILKRRRTAGETVGHSSESGPRVIVQKKAAKGGRRSTKISAQFPKDDVKPAGRKFKHKFSFFRNKDVTTDSDMGEFSDFSNPVAKNVNTIDGFTVPDVIIVAEEDAVGKEFMSHGNPAYAIQRRENYYVNTALDNNLYAKVAHNSDSGDVWEEEADIVSPMKVSPDNMRELVSTRNRTESGLRLLDSRSSQESVSPRSNCPTRPLPSAPMPPVGGETRPYAVTAYEQDPINGHMQEIYLGVDDDQSPVVLPRPSNDYHILDPVAVAAAGDVDAATAAMCGHDYTLPTNAIPPADRAGKPDVQPVKPQRLPIPIDPSSRPAQIKPVQLKGPPLPSPRPPETLSGNMDYEEIEF